MDVLYERYEQFGRQLGFDHLAVWFCEKPDADAARGHHCSGKPVDVEVSQRFCDAFDLGYMGGSYLVVTPHYPGRGVQRRYADSGTGRIGKQCSLRLITCG